MDPHFDGVIFQTHPAELRRRLPYPFPPFRVLDVRPREEYVAGHVPGAEAVTAGEIASSPGFVAPGQRIEIIVVGRGPGDPAVRAASLELMRQGAHRVVELTGGMYEWRLAGYPTESLEQRVA